VAGVPAGLLYHCLCTVQALAVAAAAQRTPSWRAVRRCHSGRPAWPPTLITYGSDAPDGPALATVPPRQAHPPPLAPFSLWHERVRIDEQAQERYRVVPSGSGGPSNRSAGRWYSLPGSSTISDHALARRK